MKRFALYGRPAIKQAPLQTYYSALIFARAKSIIRKQFEAECLDVCKNYPRSKKTGAR